MLMTIGHTADTGARHTITHLGTRLGIHHGIPPGMVDGIHLGIAAGVGHSVGVGVPVGGGQLPVGDGQVPHGRLPNRITHVIPVHGQIITTDGPINPVATDPVVTDPVAADPAVRNPPALKVAAIVPVSLLGTPIPVPRLTLRHQESVPVFQTLQIVRVLTHQTTWCLPKV